jgi:hypothetical protein
MEPRQRAPQREGQRTTLRVPEPVMRAARALADELGTTPNDAIVRLAEEGIAATDRRRRAERIAIERRDAVVRAGAPDGLGFPTAEELHAAMLSGRRAS